MLDLSAPDNGEDIRCFLHDVCQSNVQQRYILLVGDFFEVGRHLLIACTGGDEIATLVVLFACLETLFRLGMAVDEDTVGTGSLIPVPTGSNKFREGNSRYTL